MRKKSHTDYYKSVKNDNDEKFTYRLFKSVKNDKMTKKSQTIMKVSK